MTSLASGALRSQKKRFRIVAAVHGIWFVVIFLLSGWWGNLLLKQADRIAELERQIGIADSVAQAQWARTQRMLLWESSTLIALLLLGTVFVIWLYWRDGQRVRATQAFFASFTHELRTPLTSIRLQAESIADRLGEDRSHRDLLGRLLDDTSRLEGQVERALELARIEGGGHLLPRAVSLRGMVERYTQGNPAVVENQSEDVSVLADPNAVQIILRNLIENTKKHSGSSHPRIRIHSKTHAGKVRLFVRDDGVVHAQQLPEKLGELFQKGSASTGAGVGLYLVRSLMRQMGGEALFHQPGGFEAILEFQEAHQDG
jgi:signal transduction histidine kinase